MCGVVQLFKNVNPDKYSYPGYGTGFDSRSLFSFAGFDLGKKFVIFGVSNKCAYW